jgi:hypothetical protein
MKKQGEIKAWMRLSFFINKWIFICYLVAGLIGNLPALKILVLFFPVVLIFSFGIYLFLVITKKAVYCPDLLNVSDTRLVWEYYLMLVLHLLFSLVNGFFLVHAYYLSGGSFSF